MSETPPTLTVLVPCYNESEALQPLFDRLLPILDKVGRSFEVVCVNDGSRDDTLDKLVDWHHRDPRIKVVNLSRNFGKEAAMTAGLHHCAGLAVIPIDADLQDPPEIIEEMVQQWEEGADVVYATRTTRDTDNWTKRFTAGWFYKLYNALSDTPIPENTGDFRLMDRRVVEAIMQLPERNRFMKGLFNWVGFRQKQVKIIREERSAGETSWNYWKLWNFALDGITASTTLPLRIAFYIGIGVSAIAALITLFLIGRGLIQEADTPGYASTMVAILFLGGLQLTFLGVIGEYMGRMYQEIKQRPVFLIDQTWGTINPVQGRPLPKHQKPDTAQSAEPAE
ncbi:MAG: glycosyltransferase family 2 protein [Alphaproteobacteria bacterium]